MPSLITLRRKIRSIGNTKQITRAMQMVAASKMRRAQEAVTSTRAYAEGAEAIVGRLQSALTEEELAVNPMFQQRTTGKSVLIVIGSDKGLAGGYNANIIKQAVQFLSEHKDLTFDIISVGRKVTDGLSRLNYTLLASFNDFPTRPVSADLKPVAKLTLDEYLGESYDAVYAIYTKFYSTLRQAPEVKQLLPVISSQLAVDIKQETENRQLPTDYLFEPAPTQLFNYILPRVIETRLLQTFLEAIASEQSSRMIAMKNATDNANDLIDDLGLTYNSIRQDNITRELAEISAGGSANQE